MNWLNTTTTTEGKDPQKIIINLDNVRNIKQRDDGRALIVYATGQPIHSEIIDGAYDDVVKKIMAAYG